MVSYSVMLKKELVRDRNCEECLPSSPGKMKTGQVFLRKGETSEGGSPRRGRFVPF